MHSFDEDKLKNGQAKDLVVAILVGDVPKSPEWHGFPCTLPRDTVVAIDTMALRMRGMREIDEEQLDTVRKAIGNAPRTSTSQRP